MLGYLYDCWSQEVKNIKMKSSILRRAHIKAIEEGKTLGRRIEDDVEEKCENKKRTLIRRDLRE